MVFIDTPGIGQTVSDSNSEGKTSFCSLPEPETNETLFLHVRFCHILIFMSQAT